MGQGFEGDFHADTGRIPQSDHQMLISVRALMGDPCCCWLLMGLVLLYGWPLVCSVRWLVVRLDHFFMTGPGRQRVDPDQPIDFHQLIIGIRRRINRGLRFRQSRNPLR